MKILKIFKNRNSFLKSVILVAGGTALAQGVGILTQPILTRLYSPKEFGILGLYMSFAGIIGSSLSLRYEQAIPLPDDEETAINLLSLSQLCLIVTISILAIGIFLFKNYISFFSKVQPLYPYLWVLPLGLFLIGIYNSLSYWMVREKQYKCLARTKITQGISMVSSQFLLGCFKVGPIGLIFGYVLGNSAGILSFISFLKKNNRQSFKYISLNRMLNSAKRYRDFPLISTFSTIFNTAGLNLPTILIAGIYSPLIAGWFTLIQKVIAIPITLIGRSVIQVFTGEAAVLGRDNPRALLRLYMKILSKLSIIAILPTLILLFASPWLIPIVFGKEWSGAGTYSQVLSIMFFVKFIASPLSQTLIILEKQAWQLVCDIVRLFLLCLVFFLAWVYSWTPLYAVIVYGIVMSGMYIYQMIISIIAIKNRVNMAEVNL